LQLLFEGLQAAPDGDGLAELVWQSLHRVETE
jgi:hypothetical protein